MFHPVGPQPPSIYWRRRLLVLGSIVLLIVLIVLTVKAAAGGGEAANGATTPTAPPTSHPATTTPPAAASSTASTRPVSSSAQTSASASSKSSTSASASHSAAPVACAAKDLQIAAVVGKTSYRVGDKPELELQVTNTGSKPCVQDLADKQVVLRVYNGESRVWGSHDCQIQPGTNKRTLAVNTPVRVAISWSGLTSQPNCAGTRQRVGAGTYTLYAALSGKTGKATQFTIN